MKKKVMFSGKIKELRRHFRFLRSGRFWKWAGVIAGAIIVLQLLFPYDRAFFFARVDGQQAGLKSEAEITALLNGRYKDAVIVTSQPDSRTPFIDAGLRVDASGTAERMTSYPLWQRFIPLSAIGKLFTNHESSKVNYLKLPLEQWASDIETKCKIAARDAGVEIREGKLAVVPSVKGAECPKKDVTAQLRATPLAPEMKVSTARKIITPKRSDSAVSSQIKKIETVIAQGASVSVLDTTVTAEPSEIVTWLTFSEAETDRNSEAETDDKTKGDNNQLKLDVDPAKIQSFVERVQRPVYAAPGVSVISVRDGTETGRSTGSNGRGIDSDDLINQLRAQLNQQDAVTATAKVVSLPPRTTYSRSYTNSTAGLQALINDIAAERGNMAIALVEIDGQRRNLTANGDKQFHPASTYKLFIAYSAIKRIEANQLKWDDTLNGTTVDECLTRMIVNSDNACAEAFNEKFGGWSATQADVKAIGATGTNLNLAEPVGTVKDQVLFLLKLHNNQLMKPENKDKLLTLMKRQKYRAGIPAGAGHEVADKVGFLSGNLHDSGIVYSPRGVYLLSIYSKGGTWGNIADAARRIEALLSS